MTNTSDFSDESLPDEELGGLEQAASVQQQRGPELRLLRNQSARIFLERDGGTHQCKLIMINHEALVQQEPLDAAVLDHCLDRGQRGLQHELYEFVGQQGEDGDGRGRRG